MLSTIRIATSMGLALSMVISGGAYAQSDPVGEGNRHVGEIIEVAVNENTFILHTRSGEDLKIQVNDETQFIGRDSQIESINDLKVGMLAIVSVAHSTSGDLIAKLIAAGDADELPNLFRVAGEIISVDLTSSTLTLIGGEGEIFIFDVSERTRFRGEDVNGLKDLSPGMRALVVAVEVEGENPFALLVAVGNPGDTYDRFRVVGEIREVNVGGEQITLVSRSGESVTISVGERTKYRGEGVEGLRDLTPGMKAIVVGVELEGGELLALTIGAALPDDLPNTFRTRGRITGIAESGIEIDSEDGRSIKFAVIDRTIFKGEGVEGLGDLEIGMQALVVGVELEEKGLTALVIAAGFREDRPERPTVQIQVAGTLVNLGDRELTVEKRDGGQVGFSVNENTVFRSRDGSVTSFADLEVGMIVVVGGVESGGGWMAVFIGAADPNERPPVKPREAPERSPGERPNTTPEQDDQRVNL